VFFTDASVSDNSNANNAWSSYLTVRGLQLDWQNGFKINGMPFVSYGITLPYEQLEQVELLKGASGFMYGFGNPGGTVNYITKKPTDVFTASAELGYRSSHLWSEHVDVGGRPADNMFGYRLNLTHEEGKPSNAVGLNRNSVSLGLDARITRDLTWTFDGIYQDRSTFGQTPTFTTYSLAPGSQLPGVVSGRGGLSRPGPALLLQPAVLLHGPALQPQRRLDGQHDLQLQQAVAQPQRVEPEPDRRQRRLHRPALRRRRGTPVQQWTTMVEGRFRTGPFSHQFVGGVTWQNQINRYSSNPVSLSLDPGNLSQPYTGVYYSQVAFNKYRASDITQKALFMSDTIQLTERWSVLAGCASPTTSRTAMGPTARAPPTMTRPAC
jgi:iron complex outermembrane receptor protein